MLEMQPGTGHDRSEWRLCSRCYVDGLKTIVVER